MINTSELRGVIYAKYGTITALSNRMSWNKNKIGKILNGSYVPNIEECAELADALEMGQQKFYEIFLPQKSPNGGNGAA